MSHYIVLVKQVPDVTQITDNAFDPETGNLMRGKLPSVINELDAQALAFAEHMRQLDGTAGGKVIALTMGPPMAEDVLRYSLARGADEAVLLTDRSLGGADTWATANPLAYAVRKIVREMLGGADDYYVVSGMQSVDGDTAQVPAQLAEEMGLPCVAYATGVAKGSERAEFTRIISGGSQKVSPRALPAVVTVAKYEETLFAGFAATRWARQKEIIRWSADDVRPTAVGVKGSKTRVIRVFPPAKTQRKCKHVASVGEFVQLLRESLKKASAVEGANGDVATDYVLPRKRGSVMDRSFEGTSKEIASFEDLVGQLKALNIESAGAVDDEAKEKIIAASRNGAKLNQAMLDDMLKGLEAVEPSYRGDVWVVAEHDNGQVHASTFELLGKARHLADSLEVKVGVVLAGQSVAGMAGSLIAGGADNVYVIEHPLLAEFDPSAMRKSIAEVIGRHWPQIVLFAATPQGRVIAPMISYRLGCGLTADCTSLDIRDSSRKGEIAVLMQTRPALGGNVMATICTKDSKCQMATARPGVFKRLPADESRKGEIIKEEVELTEDDLSLDVIETERGTGDVNFEAEIIISGGKGLASKSNYEDILNQLTSTVAEHLDCSVERGASRAAVEQGFVERVHQVGQTGTAVGPKVYLAMAISGAIQHMIGVSNSEAIFAINNDPNAPIFKQCDYYLVGNIEEIVPELTKQLGAN
ncbi:MAG: FAD-binding protein [Sedimentisphaerales bacterium]|nr:FAD-binding protein [Sedimentisphaerales bacterium]